MNTGLTALPVLQEYAGFPITSAGRTFVFAQHTNKSQTLGLKNIRVIRMGFV